MRFATLLLLSAGAAVLTGCSSAVSIHPLYTASDLIIDSSVEGTWAEPDGEIWQIRQAGDGYDVTAFHSGDTPGTDAFNAHLVRLKGSTFVDVTSKGQADLAIPGHLFAQITLHGDQFEIALLDEAWLKKNIQANQAPQSIEGEASRSILIAPTSELQRFLIAHAADPEAWSTDTGTFHRVR